MKTNLSYKKKSMKKHIDVNKNINMIKNNKTKKYKGGFSQPYINHYLDDVQGISDELKDSIYKISFGNQGVQYFVDAKKNIFQSKYIQDLFQNNPSPEDFKISEKKWIACNSQCFQQLKNYVSTLR